MRKQQKQFNRWASFYDASWFRYLFFEPTYQHTMRMLRAEFAQRRPVIAIAREKIKTFSNILIIEASATPLPFGDQSFGAVLCSDVFHHFENSMAALRSMRRVMKDGGMLLLVDPAYDTTIERAIFIHVKH